MNKYKLVQFNILFLIVLTVFGNDKIKFKSHHGFEITYPSGWAFDSARIEKLKYLDEDLNSRTITISNYVPTNPSRGENTNDVKIDINIRRLKEDSLLNYKNEIKSISKDSLLLNSKTFYLRKEIDNEAAGEGIKDTIEFYVLIAKGLVFQANYYPSNSNKTKEFKEIIGSIKLIK